ncbi:MAG: sulfatase-like hydrolase/transferase, partial [Planctomycetota bacterium]
GGGGLFTHPLRGFTGRRYWHFFFDLVFVVNYHTRLHRGLDVSDFRFPRVFPLYGLPSVKALTKPPRNPREFDWGPLDKNDLETGDGQLVQWAIDFLKAPRPRLRPSPDAGEEPKPFFLAAGIYRPHLPFYAPRKHFELYPLESIHLPETRDDDLEDLPASGLKFAAQRREDYELVVRSGKYRELVQAYLASISFADAMVGRLLNALGESEHADNTIVVLWSDHGWHLGEKQHLHKFTLWERATRIPFVVAAPGVTQPGAVCQQPVGMLDLFPTLNELCALPKVGGLSGQSIVALLTDSNRAWVRPALTSHGPGNHALRSTRWRYIRYADGDEELYDHEQDPNEWTNLATRSEHGEIKAELARWLPESDANPKRSKKDR